MLDYSQVQDIAKKAARKAKREGRKPLSIRQYHGDNLTAFCKAIPFLGDYVPTGWEQDQNIEPLFVDSSGFGSDYEPALSLRQFAAKLDNFKASGDNYGFAIVEAGEFQVYIGVFRPDHRDFTHTGNLTAAELSRLGSK